jgi:hypothetical protein
MMVCGAVFEFVKVLETTPTVLVVPSAGAVAADAEPETRRRSEVKLALAARVMRLHDIRDLHYVSWQGIRWDDVTWRGCCRRSVVLTCGMKRKHSGLGADELFAAEQTGLAVRATNHAARWIVCRLPTQGGLEYFVNMTLAIGPLVSLIAGILILAVPRLLNYIVAIYLIVIGVLGLFGSGMFHLR